MKCFHLGFSGALMSALIPVFRDLMDVEYENALFQALVEEEL